MAIIDGTAGDDTLVSLNDGDVVNGLAGNDMLEAAHNNVTLNGGSGNDFLFSDAGADGTTMDGGAGDDYLVGGGTNDTASYANDPAGVVVNLSHFSAIDGSGGIDTLVGIENVTGSAFNDTLIGDDGANVLQGGAGNDTLTGNGGADVFKFSFNQVQGGGETVHFTDFFAAHGGTVVGGEVADGTSQGQFSSLYTQWLHSLGLTVLDLGQNSGPDGTPVVQGPDGTFGDPESFTWTSGSAKHPVVHERSYSDTWSTSGGQNTFASGDGHDTIVDFAWGVDKLEFNGLKGLTEAQFGSLFTVTQALDVNNGAIIDTTLALADGSQAVTLVGVSDLHTVGDFYATSIFS